jgi:Endonuclease/Exonuclease/phosphatase family
MPAPEVLPLLPKDAAHRRSAATPRRLTLWVLVAALASIVFLICLGPYFTPESTAAFSSAAWKAKSSGTSHAFSTTNFRVLTYNVFMRPQPVGAGDFQEQRLPLLVNILSSYQIGLMQEIFWLSFRKTRILDELAKRGVPFYAAAPLPGAFGLLRWPPKLIDGGLTLTSAFPIESSDFVTFDATVWRSIDVIVAKGVLYGKLRLPESSKLLTSTCVHVFTTHAQANNGLEVGPFANVRAAQQKQLTDFIISKVGSDEERCPILLGGDFNSDGRAGFDDAGSSDEYKTLSNIFLESVPGLVDVLYVANNFSHPVTSAGGLDGSTQKNERLDYIFFSPLEGDDVALQAHSPTVEEFWASGKEPFRSASDHFAVSCSLVAR